MRFTTLVVSALLVLGSAACERQVVCASGATQPCVCTDGRTGAQFCSRDGMGWGPCQCTGPAVQPAPSAAPALPPPAAAGDPLAPAPAAPPGAPMVPAPPAPAPEQTDVVEPAAGPRTPNDIRRVIRASTGSVRACYERGQQDEPTLAGRLVIQLGITPDGAVATAAVTDDALHNASVNDCVLRTFRDMRFPPTSEPGMQTVNYPLIFN